jgi:hypothetical protein
MSAVLRLLSDARNIDLDARDDKGKSAQDYANAYGYLEIQEALVGMGLQAASASPPPTLATGPGQRPGKMEGGRRGPVTLS